MNIRFLKCVMSKANCFLISGITYNVNETEDNVQVFGMICSVPHSDSVYGSLINDVIIWINYLYETLYGPLTLQQLGRFLNCHLPLGYSIGYVEINKTMSYDRSNGFPSEDFMFDCIEGIHVNSCITDLEKRCTSMHDAITWVYSDRH